MQTIIGMVRKRERDILWWSKIRRCCESGSGWALQFLQLYRGSGSEIPCKMPGSDFHEKWKLAAKANLAFKQDSKMHRGLSSDDEHLALGKIQGYQEHANIVLFNKGWVFVVDWYHYTALRCETPRCMILINHFVLPLMKFLFYYGSKRVHF